MRLGTTHSLGAASSVPDPRAEEEAALRVDLAASYRLMAHFGLDDLIYNHISARVPGTHDQFLINPYGLLFSEVRASSFVRIDLDGTPTAPTNQPVNQAGFVIHSAIHAARADALCVLHTHSEAATAISALPCGLLPVSQSPCATRAMSASTTTRAWRSTSTNGSGWSPISAATTCC